MRSETSFRVTGVAFAHARGTKHTSRALSCKTALFPLVPQTMPEENQAALPWSTFTHRENASLFARVQNRGVKSDVRNEKIDHDCLLEYISWWNAVDLINDFLLLNCTWWRKKVTICDTKISKIILVPGERLMPYFFPQMAVGIY